MWWFLWGKKLVSKRCHPIIQAQFIIVEIAMQWGMPTIVWHNTCHVGMSISVNNDHDSWISGKLFWLWGLSANPSQVSGVSFIAMPRPVVEFPAAWMPFFLWFLSQTYEDQKQPGCISVFDGEPREKKSRISDQMIRHGTPAFSLDIMNGGKCQDMSTSIGVQQFLVMLARMAINGLVWMAPPCSSFTNFMSRSVHQRSMWNPLGHLSDFVCLGNDMAEFCAKAMLACCSQGSLILCVFFSTWFE